MVCSLGLGGSSSLLRAVSGRGRTSGIVVVGDRGHSVAAEGRYGRHGSRGNESESHG